MIQRIQTLWLFLAALCAFFTFRLSFYSGNLSRGGKPAEFVYFNATSNIPILIITVVLASLVAVDIFLYKNRTLQFRLCLVAILLSLLNLFLYYRQTLLFQQGNYDLTALLSILIPIWLFFAARGIRRDQKLVRSLNRLR